MTVHTNTPQCGQDVRKFRLRKAFADPEEDREVTFNRGICINKVQLPQDAFLAPYMSVDRRRVVRTSLRRRRTSTCISAQTPSLIGRNQANSLVRPTMRVIAFASAVLDVFIIVHSSTLHRLFRSSSPTPCLLTPYSLISDHTLFALLYHFTKGTKPSSCFSISSITLASTD